MKDTTYHCCPWLVAMMHGIHYIIKMDKETNFLVCERSIPQMGEENTMGRANHFGWKGKSITVKTFPLNATEQGLAQDFFIAQDHVLSHTT